MATAKRKPKTPPKTATPKATKAAAPKATSTPAKPTSAREQKLKQAIWEKPDDLDQLRVWADHLCEEGDPRGEFLQLKLLDQPTEAQVAKAKALEEKRGGTLVGPARPHLNYWSFDERGLVHFVQCDGPKLVAGWEEIRWLNPRLTLDITTLRKQTMATIAELMKLPLAEIYLVRIESGLTDPALAALAPGLRGVRHLSLAYNEITPGGLTKVASHLESLEFLCVAPPVSHRDPDTACNEFAEAIAAAPELRGLKAVYFYRRGKPDAEHMELLRKLPNMKTVEADFMPPFAGDVERWKRGETAVTPERLGLDRL
jgi:uncharacterized protein (TIGR02996 family)